MWINSIFVCSLKPIARCYRSSVCLQSSPVFLPLGCWWCVPTWNVVVHHALILRTTKGNLHIVWHRVPGDRRWTRRKVQRVRKTINIYTMNYSWFLKSNVFWNRTVTNNHWLGYPLASGRHNEGHCQVDSLFHALQYGFVGYVILGLGDHRTMTGLMQATGRWVTESTVFGYGSFSDKVRSGTELTGPLDIKSFLLYWISRKFRYLKSKAKSLKKGTSFFSKRQKEKNSKNQS